MRGFSPIFRKQLSGFRFTLGQLGLRRAGNIFGDLRKKADLTGLLSVRSSGSVATSTSAGLAGGHVFAIHAEADGNKWSELPEPPSLN